MKCPLKIIRSNVLITPVIESPCRSMKLFMPAPVLVAVVQLPVRLDILALRVKSGSSRGGRVWLRPQAAL